MITRSTSEMKYKQFVLGWVWRQLTPMEDAEVENKNKLGRRRRKAARVTYRRTHTAIISVASAVLTDGIDNANNASDVLDEKRGRDQRRDQRHRNVGIGGKSI